MTSSKKSLDLSTIFVYFEKFCVLFMIRLVEFLAVYAPPPRLVNVKKPKLVRFKYISTKSMVWKLLSDERW